MCKEHRGRQPSRGNKVIKSAAIAEDAAPRVTTAVKPGMFKGLGEAGQPLVIQALLRSYTTEEWAGITGYAVPTLRQWSSKGHPAWKHSRWHPVAWLAWTLGLLGAPRKGRKPDMDLAAEARGDVLMNVISLFR